MSELRKLLVNSKEAWYPKKACINRFMQRARWKICAEQRKIIFWDIHGIVVFKTKKLQRLLPSLYTQRTRNVKFEWEKTAYLQEHGTAEENLAAQQQF